MTRLFLIFAAGVALAACQPAVPDSGRGVGFDDPIVAERRAREAALAGPTTGSPVVVTSTQSMPVTVVPPAAPVTTTAPAPATSAAAPTPAPAPGSAEATAAETTRILEATRPASATPVQAAPTNPPPPLLNEAGISNENSFEAVSGQRSIESDAALIASNSAQYQVVAPEALPDRTNTGPNIVAFALQTQHAVGTKVYRRGFTREAKFQRACAGFASADQAQIEFLAKGGPDRDRAGMDPDGDGFACSWDPTPFRRAAQQG